MNKEYDPGKNTAEERKENHGETKRLDDFLRNTILRYVAKREWSRVIYMLMFATPWFRHFKTALYVTPVFDWHACRYSFFLIRGTKKEIILHSFEGKTRYVYCIP